MIVGLMGYAQSGKDTVAAHLVQRYGFRRLAFADALKSMALEIDPGIGGHSFEATPKPLKDIVSRVGWEEAKRTGEVRGFLQNLGLAARNTFGADCWVNIVERDLFAGNLGEHVVVTDVRFPNEVVALQGYDAELWRLERPGTGPVNSHVSESAVADVEAWPLSNDGTIEDLHVILDDLMLLAQIPSLTSV